MCPLSDFLNVSNVFTFLTVTCFNGASSLRCAFGGCSAEIRHPFIQHTFGRLGGCKLCKMAPLLHVCSAPVVNGGGSLKSKRSECDVVHCTDSRVPIANERGRFQTLNCTILKHSWKPGCWRMFKLHNYFLTVYQWLATSLQQCPLLLRSVVVWLICMLMCKGGKSIHNLHFIKSMDAFSKKQKYSTKSESTDSPPWLK